MYHRNCNIFNILRVFVIWITFYMYINTFKNEVTTDQKGKLLLNTCGILFYCRNGEKSTAIKRMQTVQGSLLRFLFFFILLLTSK